MLPILRRSLICLILVVAFPMAARAVDTVELTTGAKATGTIKSHSGSSVVIAVKVGKRTITRTYPKSRIKAYTVDGKRFDPKSGSSTTVKPGGRAERSQADILVEIDRQGKTPPDWFESTPLNYPKSLDLAWPIPPPKGWNSSKNIGQFLWDRINPNANK
jgi:hypothetical protein